MAKPIITIIGLGTTGASLGLALGREDGNFEIVGHDKEPETTQNARKAGAIQRGEWNLHRACEGADMVITTVPLSELEELLPLIGEDLKPGGLLFANVNVMRPAIEMAERHLPEHVHFVAGHPVLSGIGGPLTTRVDLFEEIIFCLAPGLQANPGAVQLASDLVERVGAKPFYVDAQEHDGIIAQVEQLPQLMAAVMMQTASTSASWKETKRLAGRRFAQTTDFGQSAQQLFSSLHSNLDNLIHRIDQLQQDLAQWRGLLEAEALPDEEHPLLTALQQVVDAREQWEAQAFLKRWDQEPIPSSTEAANPGMLRQMFFGGLMGGRGTKKR